MNSTAGIINQAIEGSKEALLALYDENYTYVFQAVYRLIGNKMDAEDIAHDAFLDAFDKLKSLKDESKFRWWVKRIAINKTLESFRGPKNIQLDFDIQEPTFSPEETSDWEYFSTEQIIKALDFLPDGYKVVLTLYLFEDMSHDEIGAKLGIKESASRSQLSRAKVKLKSLLEESYGRVEK